MKAGFLGFHTWLPLAHPAAPSHISGVMSGVIVKMGIYGIFRIITFLKADYLDPGRDYYYIVIVNRLVWNYECCSAQGFQEDACILHN